MHNPKVLTTFGELKNNKFYTRKKGWCCRSKIRKNKITWFCSRGFLEMYILWRILWSLRNMDGQKLDVGIDLKWQILLCERYKDFPFILSLTFYFCEILVFFWLICSLQEQRLCFINKQGIFHISYEFTWGMLEKSPLGNFTATFVMT